MRRLGSAKWNFLKGKNTSPEQTSLLNNTTLMFLSTLLWQAVIIYKGWVFGLLLRERSWLLFWCLNALQHDGWQIDYKLFEIYASTNAFWYGNEQRKDFLNCGFSAKTLWVANSWDVRYYTITHFGPAVPAAIFWCALDEKSRKSMLLSFFFFYSARELGSFFFGWGKWTYVHTATQTHADSRHTTSMYTDKHTCTFCSYEDKYGKG